VPVAVSGILKKSCCPSSLFCEAVYTSFVETMDGLPSVARKALLRYTSSVVACYGGWKATEGILLYVNPNLGAFLDGLPSVAKHRL
jgi:hypothetical protein